MTKNLVCKLCGAKAYLAEGGNYRHVSTKLHSPVNPWDDGSGFCDKYGYPIEVESLSEAQPVASKKENHIAVIAKATADLNDDELHVIARICERLMLGATQYGPLHIASDPRDWREEHLQEMLDGTVYSAVRLIKEGK